MLSVKTKVFNSVRTVFKLPVFENILLLATKGKNASSIFFKITPNPYQYKNTSTRKATRNGINYHLYPSDAMDWFVYFGFSEGSKEKLFKMIKPGYHIIDIGANIGETTLNFAKLTGSNGNILSLEPDSGNFKKLISNIKLNNFSNIKALKIGAGEKFGRFNLITPEYQNTGMMRIREQSAENNNLIEIAPLDSIVEVEKLLKLDFIKIDVEGYELKVLKGAAQLLQEHKPILFIELDDNNLREQNDTASDLVKFLEERNYSVKNAGNDAAITAQSDFKNCHYDIYALPVQVK